MMVSLSEQSRAEQHKNNNNNNNNYKKVLFRSEGKEIIGFKLCICRAEVTTTDWSTGTCQTCCCVFAPARLGCSEQRYRQVTGTRRGAGVEEGENKIIKKKAAFFFWQTRIPNDPLWFICDGSNTMQAACFSPWDHEQLLAHNYVVIHCYLEEKTRADS